MNSANMEYGDAGVARRGEILRTIVGSGVHGIAIEGTDDRDEMGVYIEPPEMVVGILAWSYAADRLVHDTMTGMPRYAWRTQPEGARSGPGDIDLVMYSLRKYVRLAAKGNPTALLPLFAPVESVITATPLGAELRSLRDAFLSQEAVHRFLGYMDSQHERMMGGGKQNRVPSRPELVERYGWDVKYGAHALRLAYQGWEIASMGRLTLPLSDEGPRDHVLAVKRGEVPRDEVSADIASLANATRIILREGGTPLPEGPDWAAINEFVMRAHVRTWQNDGRLPMFV